MARTCCRRALLLASLVVVGLAAGRSVAAEVHTSGTVEFVQTVKIPAEEAGVIRLLPVREGSRVQAGELLAQIDDRQAQAARKVAESKRNAARKRAEDDIELRYADAAGDVARADWDRDVEANKAVPKSVPEIQLRQKKLVWQKALLQYEKAQNDRVLAGMDADAYEAELEAANVAVERRTIRAPFDGEVQILYAHEAEWANPGDPVLQLVRLDDLYVNLVVPASQHDPQELDGCAVTATATLARGRTALVEGRIAFVDQEVQGGSSEFAYKVRAEMKNVQIEGDWVLRPGMTVEVTIRLDR
ncbi:MAG: HlyD family efflux transporter periplasmic adaptor subunit [Pirellulales bacterium]|nr:HlyD family efflux transporter periplasmic adaptor subunit [Pirellulales bacterium]